MKFNNNEEFAEPMDKDIKPEIEINIFCDESFKENIKEFLSETIEKREEESKKEFDEKYNQKDINKIWGHTGPRTSR